MANLDGKLKQRLIGALVLIVLAVVFLPMIFNNRGERIPETVVDTPPEPVRPTAAVTPPANITEPVQANANQTTTTDSHTNITNQATITTSTTNVTNRPVISQPDANGLTATWTIQVVAVGNLKNAEAFMDKLRKANYNAYIRTEGNIHRVFVGPFIEEAEAKKVQKQIQRQFKEEGIVKAFKPEKQ